MKDKIRKEKNGFDDLTIAFVGHLSLEYLSDFKKYIESYKELDLVFFKTSSGKLWIKEGNND